jgi:hypothetical protein
VRVPSVVRRAIERALPWYDPDWARHRHAETERARRRSIAARIALEDVPRRYGTYDDVVRP